MKGIFARHPSGQCGYDKLSIYPEIVEFIARLPYYLYHDSLLVELLENCRYEEDELARRGTDMWFCSWDKWPAGSVHQAFNYFAAIHSVNGWRHWRGQPTYHGFYAGIQVAFDEKCWDVAIDPSGNIYFRHDPRIHFLEDDENIRRYILNYPLKFLGISGYPIEPDKARIYLEENPIPKIVDPQPFRKCILASNVRPK